MRMIDLFSGIGGFALAARWTWGDELELCCLCERDGFCQKVLRKHWPSVPIIEDIKEIQQIVATTQAKEIDLLTAGIPCQPFSLAGKRQGSRDDRFLWPETFEIVKATTPRWIVIENVIGLISIESGMVFEGMLSDLEGQGYEVWSIVLPACAVGAPHRRDRVWIVANSYNPAPARFRQDRWQVLPKPDTEGLDVGRRPAVDADAHGTGLEKQWKRKSAETQYEAAKCRDWWASEPGVGRVAHGVPGRVDRLRALGNAIVPQVATALFEVIKEAEVGVGISRQVCD